MRGRGVAPYVYRCNQCLLEKHHRKFQFQNFNMQKPELLLFFELFLSLARSEAIEIHKSTTSANFWDAQNFSNKTSFYPNIQQIAIRCSFFYTFSYFSTFLSNDSLLHRAILIPYWEPMGNVHLRMKYQAQFCSIFQPENVNKISYMEEIIQFTARETKSGQ